MRAMAISPISALLLIAYAAGAQPALDLQLSVNVNLVVLNPSVRDRSGAFVSDLRQQDFELYEDGVRQTIKLFRHDDTAVTVGLVVDHSGSMQSKLGNVIAAARTFITSSNADDQMFVVNFNEHVSRGLPGTIQFTNRPEDLGAAILRSPAGGQTALYDATLAALDWLRAGTREKKVLIVISDGGDNASAHSLPDVLKMAAQSSAVVYTIGIFDDDDPDRNPGVLRRLAHATGGEAYFPGPRDEIIATCERIARDIRNQYTVAYVSSNVQPGGYRAIRLVARAEGKGRLIVRTRTGYLASGDAKPAAGK